MVNIPFRMLDYFENKLNTFLIGDHPFHINLEKSINGHRNAHGQFLLNSNAMDIDIQPYPALTYTTIGGIIDLYIFTGPTAHAVAQQYWAVIGVRLTGAEMN